MKGKLISIEGIDGSGKGTQAELLYKALLESGYKAKMYSFPAYDKTFFGNEIGAFLRGEFGSFEQVHPKLASILFACDRAEQKPALLNDLQDGYFVICDRYVESNAAHQSAKLPGQEREAFVDWIKQLEYEVNTLPKPDITIFLDIPIEYSKQLVLKKKQRSYTEESEDIQESQHGYLDLVHSVYKGLVLSEGWHEIQCLVGSELQPISVIHKKVTQKLNSDFGLNIGLAKSLP